MSRINQVSFYLDDLRLYLDTHERDQQAIKLYHEKAEEVETLRSQFAQQFYPLTIQCIPELARRPYALGRSVKEVGGLLTDIGTEELAHMEIICSMVYQLTKDMTIEQAKEAGFNAYYIDHTTALWPQAAAGLPFTAIEF